MNINYIQQIGPKHIPITTTIKDESHTIIQTWKITNKTTDWWLILLKAKSNNVNKLVNGNKVQTKDWVGPSKSSVYFAWQKYSLRPKKIMKQIRYVNCFLYCKIFLF
jgi:hypothetical protein